MLEVARLTIKSDPRINFLIRFQQLNTTPNISRIRTFLLEGSYFTLIFYFKTYTYRSRKII